MTKYTVKIILCVAALEFAPLVRAAEPIALAVRGGAACPVVIAAEPSPSLKYAAEEYCDHVERMTGTRPSVVTAAPSAGGAVRLVQEAFAPGDEDSFTLRSDARSVTVRGGSRGVLYGVYELLESYGDVCFTSPTYTYVPRRDRFEVPSGLRRTETPAFDVRWPGWGMPRDRAPAWAARLRFNGSGTIGKDPKYGGIRYRFAKGWTGHTFHKLCHEKDYGKTHPEYFSEIRGRRRLTQTQLCTTNPDVREIACSNLFAAIRKEPDADVWAIGQNDYDFHCECAKCAAIDAREESTCGAMLEFVNFLADRVAKEFPGKLIKTSAYQFTRKPPKYLRPATNVVINLCAIECDFSRPFGSPNGLPVNLDFERDFATWSRLATRMSIYDYTTNYRFYMHPFPNLQTIAGDLRYYRDRGVKILYCEGGSAHADLAELKPWLIGKLAWDPDRDLDELIGIFCRAHYGKAAPHVLNYIREARACIEAHPDKQLSIFEGNRPSVYTDAFLDRQLRNFREAERAVADDPDRLHNLRMTAAIVYATKLDYLVSRTKFWWATERPEAFADPGDAAELFDWMEKRGTEAKQKGGYRFVLCANRGKEEIAHRDWARLAAWKRPVSGSTMGFIPALEMMPATPNNGFHGGWFVKETSDPAAHGGRAAELNTAFEKRILEFDLRNVALDAGATYAVRVRVRGEAAPDAKGEAFAVTFGGRERLSVPTSELSSSWKWYSLGEIKAAESGDFAFFVGRVARGGDGAVARLFVDGVEFCKKKGK